MRLVTVDVFILVHSYAPYPLRLFGNCKEIRNSIRTMMASTTGMWRLRPRIPPHPRQRGRVCDPGAAAPAESPKSLELVW